MPLLDHFGILAPFYDKFIRVRTPLKIQSMTALPTKGKLLDAGGGTGRIAYALRNLVDEVIVADESILMLKQAKSKDSLIPVGVHTERLPFPNNSFERVMIVDAIHHVIDAKATCGELWRVLKEGGRLVIEEPDIRTFPVIVVAIAEKLALMRSKFISPLTIASYFSAKNARVSIEKDGYTSWVIVEKLARLSET